MNPEDEAIIKEALKLSIKSRDSARNLALKKAKQAASWKKKADAAEAERDEARRLAEEWRDEYRPRGSTCDRLPWEETPGGRWVTWTAVPPSGIIAGVYSRTDESRPTEGGVERWK